MDSPSDASTLPFSPEPVAVDRLEVPFAPGGEQRQQCNTRRQGAQASMSHGLVIGRFGLYLRSG
ncbi:MAG: hypothetical protein M5U31_16375, partial [Acidimicrobiia bacterium]|nr:hypothetical protein [Acidimicrobiia bacterium]